MKYFISHEAHSIREAVELKELLQKINPNNELYQIDLLYSPNS